MPIYNNMKLLALLGTTAGVLSVISYINNLPEIKSNEFLNYVTNNNLDPTTALHLCIKSKLCSLEPRHESTFFKDDIESSNSKVKDTLSGLFELGANPFLEKNGINAIDIANEMHACAQLSLKRSTCEEQLGSCSENFINNNVNFHACDMTLANELSLLFNNTFSIEPAPAPEYNI